MEPIHSGRMSQRDITLLIHNMEEAMKDANVDADGIIHYAIMFLGEDATSWWRMHSAMDNTIIIWEDFKKILRRSRLIADMPKSQNDGLKEHRACKICGEVGHTTKWCP